MKLLVLILLAVCCAAPSGVAADYQLDNGYIRLRAAGGAIHDLQVDPSGKGDFGPVIARVIYVGEQPQEADYPFEPGDGSITFKNVGVFTNPREVGLGESDTPVRLEKGSTLGQLFTVDQNGMASVAIKTPTWHSPSSAVTLRLLRNGPGGELVRENRFENVVDNSWITLEFAPQPKGAYYIEMSDPRGPVGWWSSIRGPQVGRMYDNGAAADFGSRCFRARIYDVFPAQIRISLVGPKLFAEATPDKPQRSFNWRAQTPFDRAGYETRDPARVPFSRFYSNTGQYLPVAQLKRLPEVDSVIATQESVTATGNGKADILFGLEEEPLGYTLSGDALVLKLGRKLAVTVKPHPEPLPDFYPAFYSSDPTLDRALNSIFYDRAFSWPIGGVNADWFEWMALIHFWNSRPGVLDHWRRLLLTYKIDDQGYVYTWGEQKGWPFPDNTKYDTRHFTTNSTFILACYRFYAWTKDREFLANNAARIRKAMDFLLGELNGSQGLIVLPDKDHGGTPNDVPSNYWDDLPFGGTSAYGNTYFYAALGAMASIETALGNSEKANYFNELREACRKAYNERFWNDAAGRYIGCIDENGVVRDYGFTYVNMEAAVYGLPDKAQVLRIYHWMERDKTSSGKPDTYSRWRFAPRANTIDCSEWWYLGGKAEVPSQPFDKHLENGGAILYTSGYDIMARAKHISADNAYRRLTEILDRYEEPDRLAGGSPLRYGELNGWQVGTDVPFPESGLVGASFLYAFLGIQATGDGLLITPNLPSKLEFAGVRNLHYRGLMLDVKITRNTVTISCDDPKRKFRYDKALPPGQSWLFSELEK